MPRVFEILIPSTHYHKPVGVDILLKNVFILSVPTCKLDQNLTMNPIEFLENASKVDNRDAYTYNDEFNAHQFAYSGRK